MPNQLKMRARMHASPWSSLRMCAVLVLATCGLAGHILAQDQPGHDRIYVVAHVDIIPPQKDAGTKLVKQYVADTRKDQGLVRIDASSEISRGNHISIVEVWQNRKAFDEHLAAEHTRQFRQQLDPMLGSPYDERLHQSLE
ncbi:MAG TPA: antibiotic biosynthesis monooxygenase [Candidatus Acidoferrales bacterium]|nr:antibiotic biosynthesis monooxygenase [Candidatus Acidoferrales bacterium]